MSSHIVKKVEDHAYLVPPEFEGRSTGYLGDLIVNEGNGGVQMGFQVSRLDPGGAVAHHLHSFEETLLCHRGRVGRRLAGRILPVRQR